MEAVKRTRQWTGMPVNRETPRSAAGKWAKIEWLYSTREPSWAQRYK